MANYLGDLSQSVLVPRETASVITLTWMPHFQRERFFYLLLAFQKACYVRGSDCEYLVLCVGIISWAIFLSGPQNSHNCFDTCRLNFELFYLFYA